MTTPAGARPTPDSDDYGCNWNSCGLPGRPYQNGIRCPAHTPAALRGLPEIPPGPGWPRHRQAGGAT